MTDVPSFSPSSLPLRVDFDMEMDVVVDDVFAEEAEEFARAVVAAEFGAIELEHALAGEARAVHGDEHGELQRAADAPEREGAAQEMVPCLSGWMTLSLIIMADRIFSA